jgi:hypothetical protein
MANTPRENRMKKTVADANAKRGVKKAKKRARKKR